MLFAGSSQSMMRSVTGLAAIEPGCRPVTRLRSSKETLRGSGYYRWRSNIASFESRNRPLDFAFAFDIDGVLLRSSAPTPNAPQTLKYLQSQQIPFILLTNGGGKHESQRVADINRSLALNQPLTTKNFIQSHTPIASFLTPPPSPTDGSKLSQQPPKDHSFSPNATVLVVGGDGGNCRSVAESYGFRNVVTPGDILCADPAVSPFSGVFKSYYDTFARELPAPLVTDIDTDHDSNSSSDPVGTDKARLKIDAIFIFNDPRDWALDIQIIIDILLSNDGIVGTRSPHAGNPNLPNRGYQIASQPPLYFSNPDLLWAAGYHLPRLGQGGFQRALEGVWKEITGGVALKSWAVGKPSSLMYGFAEDVLMRYRRELELGEAAGEVGDALGELKTVYMVGDNPESDIMGANNHVSPRGTEWVGALVQTGVYGHDRKKNANKDQKERVEEDLGRGSGDNGAGSDGIVSGDPRYDFTARPELKPEIIVEDVRAAVNWGLGREGWKGRVGY